MSNASADAMFTDIRRLASRWLRLAALHLLAIAAPGSVAAQQQSPASGAISGAFAGKLMKLYVGAPVGAAYDLVGRAVAAHLPRFISGQPTVIVENMPGAASIVMINHLYNRAPRDGAAFGLALNGIVLEDRLKVLSRDGSNVRFEVGKLGWLGSPAQEPIIFLVWHATPFRSVEDLNRAPAAFGTSSQGTDNYVLPIVANRLLGTQINVAAGYKGVGDLFLAMERGELQGAAVLQSNLSTRPDWLRDGKIRVLLQFGTTRLRQMPEVPAAVELASDAEARELLGVYANKFKATYPFILPPDVPAERASELRAAFDAVFKDARFIADAARVGVDVDPVSGDEIRRLIEKIQAVPQPVMDRLRKLVE